MYAKHEYYVEDLEWLAIFKSKGDLEVIDRANTAASNYKAIAVYEYITSQQPELYKKNKSLSVAIASFRYTVDMHDYGAYQPFNWNIVVSDGKYIREWMKVTKASIRFNDCAVYPLFRSFHHLYRKDIDPIRDELVLMEQLINTKRSETKEAGRLMMLRGIVEGDERLFREGADFSVKKRKRLFTPDDGIDHCVDIIGMLKLAHYNGLDFEYESEYVPQELVAYTPIDISDDPVFLRVKEAYRNEHPEIQAVWDEMEKVDQEFESSNSEITTINTQATSKIEVAAREEEPTGYLVRRLLYEFDMGQYYEPYLGHFLGQYSSLSEANTAIKAAELHAMKQYSEWYWMMPFPGVMDDEDEVKEELVRIFKERHGLDLSWDNFDWQRDYYEVIGLPPLKDIPEAYLETIREVFKIRYFKVFPMYKDSKLYTIRRRPHAIFTDPSLWIDSAPYYWEGSGEPVICMSMEEAEKTVVELFQTGDAGNQQEPSIRERPWQELYEIVEYPVEKAMAHTLQEFGR